MREDACIAESGFPIQISEAAKQSVEDVKIIFD